jgi:histidinol-phosphatase (PHP family)
MIENSDIFSVLAHIDYPFRYSPSSTGLVNLADFELEFRESLRALARSGRAMEINTNQAAPPELVSWWLDAGGSAVSFGSDAHSPAGLAKDFTRAAALAEHSGSARVQAPGSSGRGLSVSKCPVGAWAEPRLST